MKYSAKFKALVRQTIKEKFEPMLGMNGQNIARLWLDRCPICESFYCRFKRPAKSLCPIKELSPQKGCLSDETAFAKAFAYFESDSIAYTRTARSHVRKVIKWLETFLEDES